MLIDEWQRMPAIWDAVKRAVDLYEAGHDLRRPQVVMAWLRAYAAATSTTTSWEKIRNAASPGTDSIPAKTTVMPYIEV